MILKRCASAAPTIKLTVESTSTFGLPDFNGFAAGRLLPNTLILREGGSRYTTEFGIKIPALIPANDLGRRFPTDSGTDRYPGISGGSLAGTFLWSTADSAVCHPKSAGGLTSYRTTDRWGRRILGRCGCLHERVLRRGRYLAPGRNQKLDKIATTGHDAPKSRPAMPQATAGGDRDQNGQQRREWRCFGFCGADFVVSAASEDMRGGARSASASPPPLRGYPVAIPRRRFFRIQQFSPLAEGVEGRSIAWRVFRRMGPILSLSYVSLFERQYRFAGSS